MVRPRRIELTDGVYHLYNRFIEGQRFFNTPNYKAFLNIFNTNAEHFHIDVLLITCMPTHFHSIIHLNQANLSAFLQKYGTGFARYINHVEEHRGHVFQNRHQTKLITSDEYFLNCLSYVIYNPVDAGIVEKPEQYEMTTLKQMLSARTEPKYDLIYRMFHQERHTGRKILRKWIHSSDIEDRYREWMKESVKQVNGDNVENSIVFSGIDRREADHEHDIEKRDTDFNSDSVSIKTIKDIVRAHRNRHRIKHIWKSERSFARHLKWYLLRHYAKLGLSEIARMDRMSRHTTVSEALRKINNNRKKREIVIRIAKKEDLI